ncbi:2-hydroxymuconate-semialdehyde hydrolase [Spinactinospora alkalitolerans]|uniref:2-hydroxymuconate-semialdehyde hydrolase n=1 Tax=Spinactinospora alkalitolerans TaxID=687207 RepID=A0A852TT46_9ACTN|nr:alpha/beta hydrolase [Spinactinospora alkalitolerans]NYE47179.1 2-hydroxymuconate-semialdehyde hydrolase [Spinactinospora alkalitolerans]
MPAAITSTDISLGEHSLRVNTAGDPSMQPLLFLHGSGPGVTALSNWERLITDLGDRYYCIAPDVLGFGDSDHPDPPPAGQIAFTELRVETIWRLLDKLGADRVNLVGNSYGGMMSLKMTVENPERVGKVILMGSGGAPGLQPTPGLKKLITFYDDPTEQNMAELLSMFVYDPASFGDKLGEIAAARIPRATREDVRRSHLAMFDDGPKLAYSPEDLAKIEQDFLVIVGREDRIVPIEASHYLAEHIPSARLVVIGRCGHWSQIEYPERFENMVSGFVEGRL